VRDQLGGLVGRARIEREVADVTQRLPRWAQRGAERRHEQHAGVDDRPEQLLDQLERGGIGPVEVLHHGHDRPALGVGEDVADHDVDGAPLERIGLEPGGAGKAEERRKDRRGIRDRDAGLGEQRLDPPGGAGELLAEVLGDRMQRAAPARVRALELDDRGRRRLEPRGELAHEP
jgi:hypothetical protein